jgi:solute carrier family 15 oligopeptide transporter 1
MFGLFLIGAGAGGIKPCVAAFGGDQFKLPEQMNHVTSFFLVFYFSINLGATISTYLTPVLRKDVHCFGEFTCYPLAFGVPGLLMAIATIIIICGKRLYTIRKPEGNVLLPVVTSIGYALKKKLTSKAKVDHWMDHALDKYTRQQVEDVKSLSGIAYMLIPVPLFWTLFDQMSTTWTFQAAEMSGYVTSSQTIKPDQMNLLNSVLILILLPIFNYVIYPLFGKCGLLKSPLQRMGVGGFLAVIAFVITGVLELEVMKTRGIVPSPNHSQIHMMNGLGCPIVLSGSSASLKLNETTINSGFNHIIYDLMPEKYVIRAAPSSNCSFNPTSIEIDLLDSEVSKPQ